MEEVEGLNWRKPGFDQQSTHPVTCVSWDDATAFCQWLSREDGRTYRLPTEAEWEYACRAGTDTLFFWGDDPDAGEGYLNAADETGTPDGRSWTHKFNFKDGYAATSPVGRFKPNAFGLHDMLGNVWEWCSDWYAAMRRRRWTIPRGLRQARTACSAAAAGTTARGSAGRRTGTGARRLPDSYLGFRLALVQFGGSVSQSRFDIAQFRGNARVLF
jgi:formylglycine-generating enzyme required for sulfatase activity